MSESSEVPQPTPTPTEVPAVDIPNPEPMPVYRQPVSPKAADLVTPAVEPKRNIMSKALSVLTLGKLGK